MQITLAVMVPQSALCRAFCTHYATVTGTGLAQPRPALAPQPSNGDQDNE